MMQKGFIMYVLEKNRHADYHADTWGEISSESAANYRLCSRFMDVSLNGCCLFLFFFTPVMLNHFIYEAV